jgi:hypothetical protein
MSARSLALPLALLVTTPAWAVPITAPTIATFGPATGIQQNDVAALDDFNGDGRADMILGDPSINSGGLAHIRFSGPPAGFAAPPVTLFGMTPGDQFGYSVDGQGDFNCDGAADFVVGAPTDNTFAAGAGAVYVFYGIPGLGAIPAMVAPLILIGELPGDLAGTSVQLIPDYDFDGCDDIAIGAPAQTAGGIGAGAVYLVPSSAGYAGFAPLNAPGITKLFGGPGDAVGWSVDTAGDFTADGRTDIIAGAPRAGGGVGQAHIVPNVSALFGGTFPIGPVGMTIRGPGAGTLFGWSVDGGSDLDGNGSSEVLIGAPFGGFSTTVNPRGSVHLSSLTMLPFALGGVFPSNLHTAWYNGVVSGGQLGWDVSFPGDYNGDGRPDLAASANRVPNGGGNGITYIRRGTGVVPPPGLIGAITMAPAPGLVTAAANFAQVGYALDGSPDNDGDGRPDLLVTAWRGPATALLGRNLAGSY